MHLYLIGYRGCGKSTVGRLVASKLVRPILDSDDIVEHGAGRTIREIFASEGEGAFRDLEAAALQEIAGCELDSVVSLGGGAVLRDENQSLVKGSGLCVWLNGTAEELYRRIEGDSSTQQRRPQLTAYSGFEEVAELIRSREPLYRNLAEKIVDVDGRTPDEIADEIVEWFRSR